MTTDGSDRQDNLVGAIHVVSGLTLLSRIGGLARDVVTARIFGDTVTGSAFAAAFTFPNLFRRLFGEGALSAAFLPEYAAALKQDPDEADRFASLILALVAAITGALTIALEIVLILTLLLAPHHPDRALTLRLVVLMLPFMPLVCFGAIMGGMLQVHGRFAMPAAAPLVLNVCLIAGGAWHFMSQADVERTSYVLGAAVLLAGVLQVAWGASALRRHVRWTRRFGSAHRRARAAGRRFVPVLIGLGTLQLNTLLDAIIAMWPVLVGPSLFGVVYPLDGRSYVILSHSTRLYQFPLGVFGIAVATAVFPLLARQASDRDSFVETLRRGIRLSLFIGLPASVGLALVRVELPAVMYSGGGGFSAEGIARSSLVLLGYAPAIWAYALNHVFARAFYATGDTLTPMKIAMAMVGLNLALNLVLIWPLGEAGLAWSTCATAMLQCVILWRVLESRLGGAVIDRQTTQAAMRMLGCALLMGLVVWITGTLVSVEPTWAGSLVRLAALCGTGVVAYTVLSVRATELRWLLGRSIN